jgi:Holliday junction resolvasome RuvABC endonuclease subunit
MKPRRTFSILAFDPNATRTGYAWLEVPGPASAISMSHFDSDIRDRDDRMRLISVELKTIISAHPKPDLIVLEAAMSVLMRPLNASQLMLCEIQGKIEQAATDYSVPFEHVAPSTWRSALYGKGGGKLPTKLAKKTAMEFCAFRRTPTPANHDEAEAACIALWAADCSVTMRKLRYLGAAA